MGLNVDMSHVKVEIQQGKQRRFDIRTWCSIEFDQYTVNILTIQRINQKEIGFTSIMASKHKLKEA